MRFFERRTNHIVASFALLGALAFVALAIPTATITALASADRALIANEMASLLGGACPQGQRALWGSWERWVGCARRSDSVEPTSVW